MAAHRYWQIKVNATRGAGTSYYGHNPAFVVGDLEFRSSIGGADETGSGTAFASSGSNPYDLGSSAPWNAFNDSPSNAFFSGDNVSLPQTIGYDFGAGQEKDIVEVAFAYEDYDDFLLPYDFEIQFSDDGVTFYTSETYIAQSMYASTTYEFLTGDSSPQGTGIATVTLKSATWTTIETGAEWLALKHNAALSLNEIVTLAIEHVVSPNKGVTSLLIKHVLTSRGFTLLNIEHDIYRETGAAALKLAHQVASGISLTLKHNPSIISFPQTVVGVYWRLKVVLDGFDISDMITDAVNIVADAGAARTASVIIKPVSGVTDSQEWVKKKISIDYQLFNAGAMQSSHRRFTGEVNLATFDPHTKLTSLDCFDNLQAAFEERDQREIAFIAGGYHDDNIFTETDDGWEYLQQRLETQTASIDKNHYGEVRKWDWQAKPSTSFALTDADIVDDSLTLTQNSARDIVNSIDVELSYRYTRNWQRELRLMWQYGRSFGDYLSASSTLPNREMVLSAISGNWLIKSALFTKLPVSGWYPVDAKLRAWSISDELREQLITAANVVVSRRWNQDVIESHVFTVQSPASIDRFGIVTAKQRYSVDTDDNPEFENDKTGEVATFRFGGLTPTYQSPDYIEPQLGSVKIGNDYYKDNMTISDFNNAVKTAIAIARVDILASHHQNDVTVSTLLNPEVDLGETIFINAEDIQAKGVISSFSEFYDLMEGSAITEQTISIYAPNISSQIDDGINAQSQAVTTPPLEVQSVKLDTHLGLGAKITPLDDDWRGYLGNYSVAQNVAAHYYPVEFRVEIPEVSEEKRSSQEFESAAIINVAIPQELLTITV